MFDRYADSVKRRIYNLFSRVIDNHVKLGIEDPRRITDNFIAEIRSKKLDTWKSLEKYIDTKYFYDQCIQYAEQKVDEYKERYGRISNKGRVTTGQIDFLTDLIEKSLKHKKYKVRMAGLEKLKDILRMLSKSSASKYIDVYREILGYTDKKDDKNEEQKEGKKEGPGES
ncbi:MAG: hypothetical protein H0Z24_03570 [Thermosipho sp. (in: Bacteria)]|nr:hypothetical protein [Thermosipho sp. (in: thermotogales)]